MPSFRIFVASPADVVAERDRIREVLARLQTRNRALTLDTYFWETDAFDARAGFQEQIPDPAQYDLFLMVLWSRLGLPLDHPRRSDGSQYGSGTEYEFERALSNNATAVRVYRKTAPVELDPDDHDRRRELDRFHGFWRSRFQEAQRGHHVFRDVDALGALIERHVQDELQRRLHIRPPELPAISESDSGPSTVVTGGRANLDAIETVVARPQAVWKGKGRRPDALVVLGTDGKPEASRRKDLRALRDGPISVGRISEVDGRRNQIVLGHDTVSRVGVQLRLRDDGRTVLKRVGTNTVSVGPASLEEGEERTLHHGEHIAIGAFNLSFRDGRYALPFSEQDLVDPRTGLLGRRGLAVELALSLAEGSQRIFVASATRREDLAAHLAAAIHERHPVLPVGRVGCHAVALLPKSMSGDELGERLIEGWPPEVAPSFGVLDLRDEPTRASRVLEAALGAMERRSLKTPATGEPLVMDLAGSLIEVLDRAKFATRATELLRSDDGSAFLMVIEEQQLLDHFGPTAKGALQAELIELAARRLGPNAVLSSPAPGVVAVADACPLDDAVVGIGRDWRALGPVWRGSIAVARGVSPRPLTREELIDLESTARAAADARPRVESLPYPIAVGLRRMNPVPTLLGRLNRAQELLHSTWKLLAFAAVGQVPALRVAACGESDLSWPTPWRAIVMRARQRSESELGAIGQLLQKRDEVDLVDNLCVATESVVDLIRQVKEGLTTLGEAQESQLDRAMAKLLDGLQPLRPWSLIKVDNSVLEGFGDPCYHVTYTDFTGSFEHGTRRRTDVGNHGSVLWAIAYLARLDLGEFVPLEPHVRTHAETEGATQSVVLAERLICDPGQHAYRRVIGGDELQLEVTAKHLPQVRPPVVW